MPSRRPFVPRPKWSVYVATDREGTPLTAPPASAGAAAPAVWDVLLSRAMVRRVVSVEEAAGGGRGRNGGDGCTATLSFGEDSDDETDAVVGPGGKRAPKRLVWQNVAALGRPTPVAVPASSLLAARDAEERLLFEVPLRRAPLGQLFMAAVNGADTFEPAVVVGDLPCGGVRLCTLGERHTGSACFALVCACK